MMTTDAFPKFACEGLVLDGREITLVGMTKGAGMIAPRMALVKAGPTGHGGGTETRPTSRMS
jgi:N-acetylglutamate synthase/N-acetylornithine aminotransferase